MVCAATRAGSSANTCRNKKAQVTRQIGPARRVVRDFLDFPMGYRPVSSQLRVQTVLAFHPVISPKEHHACWYDVKALNRFNCLLLFSCSEKEPPCICECSKEET